MSRDVIPDIYMFVIVMEFDAKYDTMLNANIKNTSVIGFTLIKLRFLNAKLVKNPNTRPNPNDTTASNTN